MRWFLVRKKQKDERLKLEDAEMEQSKSGYECEIKCVESACGVFASIMKYSNNTCTHEERCWRSVKMKIPKTRR